MLHLQAYKKFSDYRTIHHHLSLVIQILSNTYAIFESNLTVGIIETIKNRFFHGCNTVARCVVQGTQRIVTTERPLD